MTDGKVPVFPIKAYKKGAAGAVSLEVTQDGFVKFVMRVDDPNHGTNKYGATAVLTGFYNGQDGHILFMASHTLTVGGDPIGNSTERETWLHHIAPGDIKNIRHYRLELDRDKSGADLADQVIHVIKRSKAVFKEAEALYKEVKDSELGQDIATAAA